MEAGPTGGLILPSATAGLHIPMSKYFACVLVDEDDLHGYGGVLGAAEGMLNTASMVRDLYLSGYLMKWIGVYEITAASYRAYLHDSSLPVEYVNRAPRTLKVRL